MRYQYGNFQFDIGECSLDSVQSQSVYTPRGGRFLISETHNCSGEIIPPHNLSTVGQKQSWIADRVRKIEQALGVEGYDAGMLNDNGTRTENFLFGSQSASGIRMTKPISFGKRDEADGVSGRTFSFAITSEQEPVNSASLYDYRQQITYEGNAGPEYQPIEMDAGPPILQQIKERTIQRIAQSGRAVGINFRPEPTLPAYPNLPYGARPVVTQEEPIPRGVGTRLYAVSWRYLMLSDTNLFRF